jgi:hypothetical protein
MVPNCISFSAKCSPSSEEEEGLIINISSLENRDVKQKEDLKGRYFVKDKRLINN